MVSKLSYLPFLPIRHFAQQYKPIWTRLAGCWLTTLAMTPYSCRFCGRSPPKYYDPSSMTWLPHNSSGSEVQSLTMWPAFPHLRHFLSWNEKLTITSFWPALKSDRGKPLWSILKLQVPLYIIDTWLRTLLCSPISAYGAFRPTQNVQSNKGINFPNPNYTNLVIVASIHYTFLQNWE